MSDHETNSGTVTGGCLCGAARYESRGGQVAGADCYCVDCRRASGTAYCSHMGAPEDGFTVTGDLAAFAKPADSGNVVTRRFCPTCGSPVFSTNSGMPGVVFIRASSLDDPEAYTPQFNVYASRAPSWAPPAPHLRSFAEMPDEADRPEAVRSS